MTNQQVIEASKDADSRWLDVKTMCRDMCRNIMCKRQRRTTASCTALKAVLSPGCA